MTNPSLFYFNKHKLSGAEQERLGFAEVQSSLDHLNYLEKLPSKYVPKLHRELRRKDCLNAAADLAFKKRHGIAREPAQEEYKEAYKQAAQSLTKACPKCGETLAQYDPEKTLKALLEIAKQDPFSLSDLTQDEREKLIGHSYLIDSYSKAEDFGKFGAEMQIYAGIGRINGLKEDDTNVLKTAAHAANRLIFDRPANKQTWLAAQSPAASEKEKLDAVETIVRAHAEALGIVLPVEIKIDKNIDAPAITGFDKNRNVHVIFYKDIADAEILFLYVVSGHELGHIWDRQNNTQLPNDSTSSELVRFVFGSDKNFQRLATERVACGYEASVLADFSESVLSDDSRADWFREEAENHFADARRKNEPSPEKTKVRRLLAELDFEIPLKETRTAKKIAFAGRPRPY